MIKSLFLAFMVLPLLLQPALALADSTLSIIYLTRANDPAYESQRRYTGLKLKEKISPVAGARAGVNEARILGRASGLSFNLEEIAVPANSDIVDFIRQTIATSKDSVFILDLPLEDVEAASAGFPGSQDIILFNPRHGDDILRASSCSSALFHTIASTTMLTDAIAQHLVAMNWKKILLLASSLPVDIVFADAFVASAKKFGIKIVDRREFVRSNDPRERLNNNLKLLTGGVEYDAIFLADNEGEFGRYLEYATFLPRPVVGTEGLVAASWHWTWERNGAPQLNQRIRKISARDISSEDWAAWAAVKSVVQAAVQVKSVNPADLYRQLLSADFSFDMYKIGPGNFRAWDHQLRQPVLLHTHNAVISVAPIDGFLHRYHTFDSLGYDEPEQRCNMQR